MRSIQTGLNVPLASIKPLDGLRQYRTYCLAATTRALQRSEKARRRERSPIGGSPLEPAGRVEELAYVRCSETGSLFLEELPDAASWSRLLDEVSGYRHSASAFHSTIAASRLAHVYAPKLTWIRDALRLHEWSNPRLLEVTTSPSDVAPLFQQSELFSTIACMSEMAVAHASLDSSGGRAPEQADVVVCLESFDRVDDPEALARGIRQRTVDGGLLFLTALVSSGFDMTVLGLRNAYLYPPDRTNCFSRKGLERFLVNQGFELLEVSTPGVLDCEIVQAHIQHHPETPLSPFEQQVLTADPETRQAFQTFLQQQGLSSFARCVARKLP